MCQCMERHERMERCEKHVVCLSSLKEIQDLQDEDVLCTACQVKSRNLIKEVSRYRKGIRVWKESQGMEN